MPARWWTATRRSWKGICWKSRTPIEYELGMAYFCEVPPTDNS
jgi:hypothetical protein